MAQPVHRNTSRMSGSPGMRGLPLEFLAAPRKSTSDGDGSTAVSDEEQPPPTVTGSKSSSGSTLLEHPEVACVQEEEEEEEEEEWMDAVHSGLPWCDTPTASMVAVAFAELAGKMDGERSGASRRSGSAEPPPAAGARADARDEPRAEQKEPAQKERPSGTVMVQVPLQVSASHPLATSSASELNVKVVETYMEDGRMVLNLRIDVGPGGSVAFAPTPLEAPKFSSSAAAAAPDAAARAARRGGHAKVAAASTEKSSMVCCHWKNKGWCRYGASCRFQHPESKRGAGKPLCAPPAVGSQSVPVHGLADPAFSRGNFEQHPGVRSCPPLSVAPRGPLLPAPATRAGLGMPLPSYGGRSVAFA